jgi:hypothetical protein
MMISMCGGTRFLIGFHLNPVTRSYSQDPSLLSLGRSYGKVGALLNVRPYYGSLRGINVGQLILWQKEASHIWKLALFVTRSKKQSNISYLRVSLLGNFGTTSYLLSVLVTSPLV